MRHLSDVLQRSGRVSAEERYLLVRQLHVLQRAGVPLLSSLRALEAQLPSGGLARSLRLVSDDLLKGSTLAQALARHPRSFSPTFVGMVEVGEAGGLLEPMLKRLAELFEWELELRSKIKQALQYPAIVLLTLSAALSVMMIFVLPRFAEFFGSLRIELPVQTRLVMALGRGIARYGWAMGLGLVGAAAILGYQLKTERGRCRWDRWILRVPALGPVVLQLEMSYLSRTIAALAGSGVPILETLALAGESLNNKWIQQAVARMSDRVKEGQTLSQALRADPLFPPVVTQMVSTGEETGRLDDLLQSVSDYYDQQTTYLVRKLVTYIEPALLILVGLGVLAMATSVLVPMWDLVKVFQHTGG